MNMYLMIKLKCGSLVIKCHKYKVHIIIRYSRKQNISPVRLFKNFNCYKIAHLILKIVGIGRFDKKYAFC